MKKLKFSFKKLSITCISLLLYSCLSAQNNGSIQIGELVENTWQITADENQISSAWTDVLSSNGVPISFSQFDIVKDINGSYQLWGTNEEQSKVCAIPLIEDGGYLYEQLRSDGGGTTVTCSGCNVGCNPTNSDTINGSWACLPNCSNGCSKTETITANAILIFN